MIRLLHFPVIVFRFSDSSFWFHVFFKSELLAQLFTIHNIRIHHVPSSPQLSTVSHSKHLKTRSKAFSLLIPCLHRYVIKQTIDTILIEIVNTLYNISFHLFNTTCQKTKHFWIDWFMIITAKQRGWFLTKD